MKHKLPANTVEMMRVMKRKKGDFAWDHQRHTEPRVRIPDGCYAIYRSRTGLVVELPKKRNEEVRIDYTVYHTETF